MKKYLAVLLCGLFLVGCGEPKTITLDKMYAVGGSGRYYINASVADIGHGVVTYKVGDTEWTNIRLRDNTGEYSFYFLPSDHPRQPAVGDNVRVLIRGKMVDSTFGGSPTVQIIEKFEFQ
jgi:hypothetical protein